MSPPVLVPFVAAPLASSAHPDLKEALGSGFDGLWARDDLHATAWAAFAEMLLARVYE